VEIFESVFKDQACFIENEINALKSSDVCIAICAGTGLAVDNMDVIISKGGISKVNVAALPLAMAGLLHPIVAETAMVVGSQAVVLSSLKISRYWS